MKNKEKFKDKIVDIVCNGGTLAVDIETNEPVDCNTFECGKCLFYVNEFGTCYYSMKKWVNQEYKDPNVISLNDTLFLGYIKDKFKYIARDENGYLYAHAIKPKKYEECGIWIGMGGINMSKFKVDFPMVKYTDEQAWKISDLKKLKVVKNY